MFEVILLYFNLLLPVFTPWTNNTTGSILHNLILIVLCSYNFFKFRYVEFMNIKNYVFYLNIFYIFIICISSFLNLNHIIIRDLFEFQRPCFYLLAFFTGQLYFYKRKIENINRDFIIFFLVVIFISLLKVFDTDNSLFYLYQRASLANKVRLSGTFISPYDFAFFLIFPIYFFIEIYLKSRKKIFLILSLVCFILIIFTESKSQIITLIISMIIYINIKFFFDKSEFKILLKYLIIILVVVGFSIVTFKNEIAKRIPYLYFGLLRMLEGGIQNDPSGNIRMNQYLKAFEIFKFWGYGPAKISGLSFENQYSLYIYRYGILGIIYNIILIFGNFNLSYILLRKIKQRELKEIVNAFAIFCFSLPIAMLANNMTDQLKISYFIYFILGIVIKIRREIKL